MTVTVSMKLTPRQAGALYVKTMRLEDEVKALKAERDALEAQVQSFKKAIKAIENDLIECSYDDESGYFVGIDSISDACDLANYATPEQCLRDIQVEAGRAGFVAGYFHYKNYGFQFEEELEAAAEKYAERIRRGEA